MKKSATRLKILGIYPGRAMAKRSTIFAEFRRVAERNKSRIRSEIPQFGRLPFDSRCDCFARQSCTKGLVQFDQDKTGIVSAPHQFSLILARLAAQAAMAPGKKTDE
jgi:hypothetical protein